MAGKRDFYVEGWKSTTCVAFAFVARAATAERRASHYTLDKGADTVWVYRDGKPVAVWNVTGGWKNVTDQDLAAAIAKQEEG